MQQEKSRALEIVVERAARKSVLVISRTMPSSRLIITVVRTGSNAMRSLLRKRTLTLTLSRDSGRGWRRAAATGEGASPETHARDSRMKWPWALTRAVEPG